MAEFLRWLARHLSYNVALLLWAAALSKPLPAEQAAPLLLRGHEYENLSPLVTTRLRELNARLLETWK